MLSPREQLLLETVPDYVVFKRYNNSLKLLEKRYPDGCPDHVVAQAVGMNEAELSLKYLEIVARLKSLMGI